MQIQHHKNPVIALALDTIGLNKQALIFANSKSSAEKTAEEIAYALKKQKSAEIKELADNCLDALDKPTKQCERLASCLKYGIAFHHAGLHSKQRTLVEEEFKAGKIKIIACTPTLAAGIHMPSFRAIIKDLKRFSAQGMDWIPILEYQQMAGRCGRPDFNDAHGEAIAIAVGDKVKDEIVKRYINGDPENIYSKLAVEPVFRTYVLSLIATNAFTNKQQLASFFEKTFWAHQYKDMQRLRMQLEKMLGILSEWNFIESGEKGNFVSASLVNNENYSSTPVGKRVAELYLDPLTAFGLLEGLKKSKEKTLTPFSFLHLISCTLEMRPLLRVGVRDMENVQQKLLQYDDELLKSEPPEWEYEYELFIDGTKTSLFLQDWIDEADEDFLYEKYGIRPGEIHVKLERADWLLFALGELAKIAGFSSLQKEINHLRIRLEYGVKEELLPLVKFNGIGKTRARILYTHGIKDVDSVKKAHYNMLSTLVGKQVANSLKDQVGIKIEDKKEESATTLKQWSAEYSVKN